MPLHHAVEEVHDSALDLRHEEEAEPLCDEVSPSDADALAVDLGEDGGGRGDC